MFFFKKCGHCDNFDICSNCETSNHDRNHVFIKIKRQIINDRFVKNALLPEFQFIEQNEQGIFNISTFIFIFIVLIKIKII